MSNPKMNLILEGLSSASDYVSESGDTVALLPIIDTWNMLEKYNIDNWKKDSKGNILISKADFQRMLNDCRSKNSNYIERLQVGVGSVMYGRGSFSGGTMSESSVSEAGDPIKDFSSKLKKISTDAAIAIKNFDNGNGDFLKTLETLRAINNGSKELISQIEAALKKVRNS